MLFQHFVSLTSNFCLLPLQRQGFSLTFIIYEAAVAVQEVEKYFLLFSCQKNLIWHVHLFSVWMQARAPMVYS